MNQLMRLIRRRHASFESPLSDVPQPSSHEQAAARDAIEGGWLNPTTGEICPNFSVSRGDMVVDVGCGGGSYSHFCASQGAHVTLVDVDAEAIARASRLLGTIPEAPRFEGRVTDGKTLPIPNGAADRVICTEVFEHVEDPVAMAKELVRIGRSGALYMLSCPAPGAEAIFKRIAHPSYFERPNHIRIIGTEEFADLVDGAGLVIEQRLNHNFYSLMHWVLFWACPPLSESMDHPLLDSWARTWSTLLEQPQGPLVKRALDDLLSKSQVIIARKP